jgi:hypothetical protein
MFGDGEKAMQTLIGIGKLAFCLTLGILLLFCHSRKDKGVSPAISSHQPTPIQEVKNEVAGSDSGLEQSIWVGRVADFQIRWTTVDIYIDDHKLLSPVIQKEFEEFVFELKKDVRPGEQMLACDYRRDFSIVSIVGTLVSLDDQYGIICAKASIGERFTTIDISNRQALRTGAKISLDGGPALPNRVRLSDYFDERSILNAVVSDPLIREALRNEGAKIDLRTLAQVSSFFEGHPASIRSNGGLFSLPADFLSRFAFDHIENNVVSVRISLQPASEADHAAHSELELLLPIPKSLERSLSLAVSRKEGFLMKDAAEVGRDRRTTFTFKTPQ